MPASATQRPATSSGKGTSRRFTCFVTRLVGRRIERRDLAPDGRFPNRPQRILTGEEGAVKPQRLDYLNEGLALERQGDYDGAIADFTKAIELNPQLAEPYNNRGTARLHKHDLDGAIADYAKAIELNPQFADAYSNRGLSLYSRRCLRCPTPRAASSKPWS